LKEDVDINPQHTIGVFLLGGYVSQDNPKWLYKKNGRLVQTFDTTELAKEFTMRMNKLISPGEKKYYGMKYTVIPLTDKDKIFIEQNYK